MRIAMMGTGTFAEPTFEAVLASSHDVVGLVTQPDRQVGKERGSTRQAQRGMKEIAAEHSIPTFQPDSINTPEGIEQLKSWEVELLVVAAYGQILSKDVLATPRWGGINVHGSLLPKYRGAAPVAWAIYHGETEAGVTIIRMSAALDAGDMLAQGAIPIEPNETAGELETRLATLGAKLAVEVVDKLGQGHAEGIKQDRSQVTKAPKLKKEHGQIDWSRSSEQVCNQIRAMQPWPTAYTFFHRPQHEPLRMIVYRAAVSDEQVPTDAAPGKPWTDSKATRLWVKTGQGCVEVHEVQPAGKRRMAASEFLRGHGLGPDASFGPAS